MGLGWRQVALEGSNVARGWGNGGSGKALGLGFENAQLGWSGQCQGGLEEGAAGPVPPGRL